MQTPEPGVSVLRLRLWSLAVLLAAVGCGKFGYSAMAAECFPGVLVGGECVFDCAGDDDCPDFAICESGQCAAPLMAVDCDADNGSPANAQDVVESVWIAGRADGTFESAPPCGWSCEQNYTREGETCVNEKLVQCVDASPRFAAPQMEIVSVEYNDTDGWSAPAPCAFNCQTGFAYDSVSGSCVCDGACTRTTTTVQSGLDDALEDPPGPMLVNYPWITFNLDVETNGAHYGGMRFALDVPQGAVIVSAKLDVYVDSSVEDDPGDDWYLQAVDDAPTFSTSDFDLSSRARTETCMRWFADDLGQGWHQSPSLHEPVQEVVGRAGWSAGNHVVVITEEVRDSYFEWRQWDHTSGTYAPTLTVDWVLP
jgi:hypothetical protein